MHPTRPGPRLARPAAELTLRGRGARLARLHATDFTPFLDLNWEADGAHDEHTSNPSTLKAHFMWNNSAEEDIAMSLADVRSMLEHYLDWA